MDRVVRERKRGERAGCEVLIKIVACMYVGMLGC